MPKYAAVAIPMQPNSNNISWLYPKTGIEDLKAWVSMNNPLQPFSDEAIEFLNALSGVLMHDSRVRTLPDVATFAFFCRKANIINLRKRYLDRQANALRLGRGVIFHIAPSNVPVNFAYSLVCGVLSGNINIVRVPTKAFEQIGIIAEAVDQVLQDKPSPFKDRVALIRYERGATATDLLSALCDVRIIWGGDATIRTIRQSGIPPRAFDVTFADRYSICAIDARTYLNEALEKKIAEDFYNDTYLFDQNACSAPHLIIWKGDEEVVEQAKEKFWNTLHAYVSAKYHLAEVLAVDKLTAFYTQAVTMNIHREPTPDNLIWRVEADKLPTNIDIYRCKAGYFTEYRVNSLSEISHIINRKYQTLAYWGFSPAEMHNFILQMRPLGLDRIVPIGKTTEFDLIWDSYDLINTLTREISIL